MEGEIIFEQAKACEWRYIVKNDTGVSCHLTYANDHVCLMVDEKCVALNFSQCCEFYNEFFKAVVGMKG